MTAGAVGLDIGGQFVKAVLVSDEGRVLESGTAPTGPATTVESLAATLAALRSDLAGRQRIDPARLPSGVGIAGVLGRDGRLRGSPHLPLLVDTRIAAELSHRIGASVAVHNDADCAAMAEGWNDGAVAGCDDFLLIALGTGVGSGLVLGGSLRAGESGYGSEFGHMTIVCGGRLCGCGNRGCVEAYISETAADGLVRESPARIQDAVARHRQESSGGAAQAVFELGAAGDEEIEQMAGGMVDMLGAAIGSVVNVLDLTTIVLGGGIAPGVLARMDRLIRAAGTTLFARNVADLAIVPASRGPLAGAIGAARLGLDESRGRPALSVSQVSA